MKAAPARPAPRRGTPSSWLTLDPAGEGLAVEDFLTMRLAAVSATLHRRVTRAYLEDSGLSLPEWRMLTLLDRHGPVSARRVALFSGMDEAQISRALAQLIARGLAARDGAGKAVALTEAGRTQFQALLPVARRAQAHLLAGLTLAERRALGSALGKLALLAERFAADGEEAAA